MDKKQKKLFDQVFSPVFPGPEYWNEESQCWCRDMERGIQEPTFIRRMTAEELNEIGKSKLTN